MSTLGDLTVREIEQSGPRDEGEFVYVDISSIDNRVKRVVEPKRLPSVSAPSRARQRLQAGDVLVSMTRPNLNAVALVPADLDGAVGSTGFHVLRAKDGVDPRWLYYAVQTRRFIGSMCDVVQGALYPAVRPKDVREYKIAAPPLTTQQRIVSEIEKQFSRLDEAVANLQRVKAHLVQWRASILCEAVGPQTNWPLAPLSTVAQVQLGQQRAPIHAESNQQIPYVRAANVTWDGLDLRDVKSMGFPNPERYRLQAGDVLLSEASGSAKEVGKPAIWNDEIPGACYQKTLIRIRARRDSLLPRFTYYFFLQACLSGQFARLAPGVGILHLTAERMLGWPIIVPPIEDQQRVVSDLDRRLSIVREVVAEVEANLLRANGLRQAILAKAFGACTAKGDWGIPGHSSVQKIRSQKCFK